MARMNESKKEAVKAVAPRKKRFNRQDENGRTDWDTISRQVCIFVACVYIYIFVYIHIIIYCMCIYIYIFACAIYNFEYTYKYKYIYSDAYSTHDYMHAGLV